MRVLTRGRGYHYSYLKLSPYRLASSSLRLTLFVRVWLPQMLEQRVGAVGQTGIPDHLHLPRQHLTCSFRPHPPTPRISSRTSSRCLFFPSATCSHRHRLIRCIAPATVLATRCSERRSPPPPPLRRSCPVCWHTHTRHARARSAAHVHMFATRAPASFSHESRRPCPQHVMSSTPRSAAKALPSLGMPWRSIDSKRYEAAQHLLTSAKCSQAAKTGASPPPPRGGCKAEELVQTLCLTGKSSPDPTGTGEQRDRVRQATFRLRIGYAIRGEALSRGMLVADT